MTLVAFAARRAGTAVVSLLILSVVVFLLVRLLPGSPALAILGLHATPQLVQQIDHQLGLDRPVPVQYATWLWHALRGNFGSSLATTGTGTGGATGTSVASIVGGGLQVTAWLSLPGIVVAFVLGLGLGLIGGTRGRASSDAALSGVSLLGISLPDFYLAILLILLFTVRLGWLPSVGFVNPLSDLAGGFRSLALPVLAVGLINMAAIARIARTSVRETLNRDFMTLATAHGLPYRVIIGKHALRNAMIPILTVTGLQLGFLFGGVVVIESVFGLPGMGRYLVVAVQQRDYPTIEGLVMAFAALFLVINLLVDVAHAMIDPRIRVSR
jgi:peptide/nickel transport system permease protein